MANAAAPASLQLFLDGQYQIQSNGGTVGYTLASDGMTITLPTAPISGELLRAYDSAAFGIINFSAMSLVNPY